MTWGPRSRETPQTKTRHPGGKVGRSRTWSRAICAPGESRRPGRPRGRGDLSRAAGAEPESSATAACVPCATRPGDQPPNFFPGRRRRWRPGRRWELAGSDPGEGAALGGGGGASREDSTSGQEAPTRDPAGPAGAGVDARLGQKSPAPVFAALEGPSAPRAPTWDGGSSRSRPRVEGRPGACR